MSPLESYLESECGEILERCSECGDCARVCRILPLTPLRQTAPDQLVSGVLEVLRGGPAPKDALEWSRACTRCGLCIDVCPEEGNPRRMLALCEALANQAAGLRSSSAFFPAMARSIRMLSQLQLGRRLLADIQSPPHGTADVVFYIGCNVLSTPHIVLNAMDLLGILGVDYRVAGSIGYCCGAVHFSGGELSTSERFTLNLYEQLARFHPRTVLTWCPTCEMHLGETLSGYQTPEFEVQHITGFLADRIDTLVEQMRTPIPRRVALHEHEGHPRIAADVKRLLGAIPGLETLVLRDGAAQGNSCNVGGLSRVPELQRAVQLRARQSARAAGAEQLVDVYHGCHRILCADEDELPLINFTDLLVEALGLSPHEDLFQEYRRMTRPEQLIRAASDRIHENEIDPAELERAFPALFAR